MFLNISQRLIANFHRTGTDLGKISWCRMLFSKNRINLRFQVYSQKITYSDVFRPFGRPVYRFGRPNSNAPKNTFRVFFFQLYFNKKYFKIEINDLTMHLLISKWLRKQKSRQKRKTMRQRGRSERRNCQRKCFHSFNYVIDHVSIHFFFYVNSLRCLM